MSEWFPPLIHADRDCRNTHVPSATFYGQAVETENFLTGYGDRSVFSKAWRMGQSGLFTDADATVALFRFRSRVGAARLRAVVMLGRSYNHLGDIAPATGPGGVRIEVTLSGGGTTTLGPFSSAESTSAPTDAPSTWSVAVDTIEIDANAVYECAVIVSHYGRPLSIEVHECGDPTISEATNYYNASTPQAGSPILDTTRSRLLVGLSDMYRANGGTICHFSTFNGAATTRSSTTPLNLIDGATTGAPTTASAGWFLDLAHHNTRSRPTSVPFELAVYGSVAGGSGGTVTLVNAAGSVLGTVTINGAAGWYTTTLLLSTTAQKYDLQIAGDGANALTVWAASLIEWEA